MEGQVIATPLANASSWEIPKHLGNGTRGLIEVKRPPICSHCISASHAQNLCNWWSEDTVAGSKIRPKEFLETTWEQVPTVKKTSVGAP